MLRSSFNDVEAVSLRKDDLIFQFFPTSLWFDMRCEPLTHSMHWLSEIFGTSSSLPKLAEAPFGGTAETQEEWRVNVTLDEEWANALNSTPQASLTLLQGSNGSQVTLGIKTLQVAHPKMLFFPGPVDAGKTARLLLSRKRWVVTVCFKKKKKKTHTFSS